jgi:hypothetical protein
VLGGRDLVGRALDPRGKAFAGEPTNLDAVSARVQLRLAHVATSAHLDVGPALIASCSVAMPPPTGATRGPSIGARTSVRCAKVSASVWFVVGPVPVFGKCRVRCHWLYLRDLNDRCQGAGGTAPSASARSALAASRATIGARARTP